MLLFDEKTTTPAFVLTQHDDLGITAITPQNTGRHVATLYTHYTDSEPINICPYPYEIHSTI